MYWHHWFGIGSFFAGLGVALGAFASHVLKDKLSPDQILTFETAVRYQMYHAFALLAVSFASTRIDNFPIKAAGFAFISGIILFSGSLYTLIFVENSRWAGPLTPIGGTCLILGWILLIIANFN